MLRVASAVDEQVLRHKAVNNLFQEQDSPSSLKTIVFLRAGTVSGTLCLPCAAGITLSDEHAHAMWILDAASAHACPVHALHL